MVHVDARTLGQFLIRQVLVDAFRGDRALTDGGGEQMRTDDVAGDEVTLAAGHLVVLVEVDEALAVVERFQTLGHVAALTDGGDDQVGLEGELGAFLRDRDGR